MKTGARLFLISTIDTCEKIDKISGVPEKTTGLRLEKYYCKSMIKRGTLNY